MLGRDGRTPSVGIPDGVVIRRSARRRRSLQARREDGVIVVTVPASLSAADCERLVPGLVERLRKRETGGRRRGDIDLERAAVRLVEELAADLPLLERLSSVTWSRRQNHRWGSCTTTTGDIRLSDRLRAMPVWVVDYVLFHELVHLAEANHTARFHDLMRRYPKHDLAKGFLHGVAHVLASDDSAWSADLDLDNDTGDLRS
jgi:predicted metal-dependent hydrolase